MMAKSMTEPELIMGTHPSILDKTTPPPLLAPVPTRRHEGASVDTGLHEQYII